MGPCKSVLISEVSLIRRFPYNSCNIMLYNNFCSLYSKLLHSDVLSMILYTFFAHNINNIILRVRGLETAPDTIKMAATIIVMPCCAGKSRQPNSTIPFRYVQTKLQSFSNWGNHNRKLESV